MYNESWDINQLVVQPSLIGYEQLVVAVHWKYTVESNLGLHTVEGYADISAPATTGAYTSYDNLTKEMVIDWVKESMGAAGVYSLRQRALIILEGSSGTLGSRQTIQGNFPWSTPE